MARSNLHRGFHKPFMIPITVSAPGCTSSIKKCPWAPPVKLQSRACFSTTSAFRGFNTKMDGLISHILGFPAKTHRVFSQFEIVSPTAHSLRVEAFVTDREKNGFLVNEFHCKVKKAHEIKLGEGATRIKETPNAGGTSVLSEAISFEVLSSVLRTDLLDTEMEIQYFPSGGSITDYSISLGKVVDTTGVGGMTVGVSVTRAMKFRQYPDQDPRSGRHESAQSSSPNGAPKKGYLCDELSLEEAVALLTKKLEGVNASSQQVMKPFHKQILHVFTTHHSIASTVEVAWNSLDDSLKKNTLVLVTVASEAPFIFRNHE